MRFDIPDSEIEWRFDPSGGPGGQHANRSSTRVELRFDVLGSGAFDEDVRERIVERLGSDIRITESGSRSQATNRKRALHRLQAELEEAAKPYSPPRRATRPSRAARQRRVERKRARGDRKRERRRPRYEE